MTATTTILTDTTSAGAAGATLPRFVGNRTRKIVLVNFNISSYTTGGEPLPTAASLNMQEVTAIFVQNVSTSATVGFVFNVDLSGNLLRAMDNVTIATQTANAVAIGTVYLMVIGY